MSVEQGVPFRFSRPGLTKRSKARVRGSRSSRGTQGTRGARSKACVCGRSPLDLYCWKAPGQEKQKVWAPWNGLVVIGKRVELLDRNPQKSKLWDPNFESELEGVGKSALKDRLGLHLERLDPKLLHGAVTLQDPASLGTDTLKEMGGHQGKRKVGAESAEGSEESKNGSEEMLASKDKSGATGRDLRSREDQLKRNGKLRSSGEKLVYKKELSIGEKAVDSGESGGTSREKGVKQVSVKEKVVDSAGKQRPSTEKIVDREEQGSIRENVVDRERRGSIREKVADSGERWGSIREKVRPSGEKLRLSRDRVRTSDEKLETDGKDLNAEELESTENDLEGPTGLENVTHENPETVTIIRAESVMDFTTQEMEGPSESVEGREELKGEEQEVETLLNELENTVGESVPMEKKENSE